jgi:hypothetical protein
MVKCYLVTVYNSKIRCPIRFFQWPLGLEQRAVLIGIYLIVTFQYSSTILYQVSYHIR